MTRRDASGWDVRWDQDRADALLSSGAWANRTMADEAAARVAHDPQRVIVVDGDRRLTAAALFDQARRLAGAFIARGLCPDDRISYQLPNWYEAIVIDLAATMAGVIVNPLVAIYREAEVGFMMEELDSRMMFIPASFRNHDYAAMIRRVLPTLTRPVDVVVLRGEAGDFVRYDDLLDSGVAPARLPVVDPNDVKLVLYTSGTTGRAKAVLHSHNTVGAMAAQFRRHLRIRADDVTLVSSPVTHITGAILAFQLPWTTGARAILMDVWDAGRAASLIRAETISVASGAAPFVTDLVAADRDGPDRLHSLRIFVAGGSAIPTALAQSAYDSFPACALLRAYGATEVPAATMGEPDREEMRRNITTDGHPVEVDLKIVDPVTGASVPHGFEGEILMTGPQAMLGYLRAEDNAAAYDTDGYFRSGDLGRFVEDDWIEVSGRAKDIIIRAGENISAKEIEEVLLQHPSVADIAIVAKPNLRTGEAACAFVVPKGEPPSLTDFADFLIERGFARQKIPEYIVVLDALPMTPAGKVQKHVLRAILESK